MMHPAACLYCFLRLQTSKSADRWHWHYQTVVCNSINSASACFNNLLLALPLAYFE